MSRLACLARLAVRSAWNRRGTLALIMVSIALSTFLLAGLERIRSQARAGFVQAISGTDLVVGARGSQLQLVLYAVFHLGAASNNLGWDTARAVASLPGVAWAIPLSMGDSHRGHPVVGTDGTFFERYKFRRNQSLSLAAGRPFEELFEVTLGSETAAGLGLKLGDRLTLTHGLGEQAPEHADKPFVVVGILAPTGSPVDRSLYVSLESLEAVHVDWRGGAPVRGFHVPADMVKKFNLTPKSITALLVGLENRRSVFRLQREINGRPGEALTAVMPGVALDQLWRLLGGGEKILFLVSALVTAVGLMGLISSVLAGLGERRRELAVLRSLGARPSDVLILLSLESLMLTTAGALAGVAALAAALAVLGPLAADAYGLPLTLSPPTAREGLLVGAVVAAGFLAGLAPAVRAYFLSLADGLSTST
ncbi:MAG: ABC transporter permease [Deltaproteobacteria bacterium]|jgi:putative ABC transport system permease protein|nr:ABC transporter permease [Deltaproteobacteria bacterium]